MFDINKIWPFEKISCWNETSIIIIIIIIIVKLSGVITGFVNHMLLFTT